MNMNLEAVIFDMDGVLVDSEPLHMVAIQRVLAAIGVEVTVESLLRFIGVRDLDMWRILIAELNLDKTPEQMIAMRLELADQVFNKDTVHPIHGIPELIAEIRSLGMKLALATSTSRENAEYVLGLLGLADTFDAKVTGSDVTKPKPNPEPYLKAAEQLGVDPARCMAVEDSALGIRAAKAAGCFSIGFANPGSGSQDLSPADRIVHRITDIRLREWVNKDRL